MTIATVDLTRCPDCGGQVTYIRGDLITGLSRFHVLPQGRLEFLCPEPVPRAQR